MPESPFISEADRNALAIADDVVFSLRELSLDAEEAYREAKAARCLLQVAANSEKPEDRDEAYRACKATQLATRAIFDLAMDVDNDAGGLRSMSHNLVRTDK